MAKKKDENQTAFSSLQELLRRDAERDGKPLPPMPAEEKDAKAVAAGMLGGLKGGRVRAQKLSAKKRKEIAKKASWLRWQKTRS